MPKQPKQQPDPLRDRYLKTFGLYCYSRDPDRDRLLKRTKLAQARLVNAVNSGDKMKIATAVKVLINLSQSLIHEAETRNWRETRDLREQLNRITSIAERTIANNEQLLETNKEVSERNDKLIAICERVIDKHERVARDFNTLLDCDRHHRVEVLIDEADESAWKFGGDVDLARAEAVEQYKAAIYTKFNREMLEFIEPSDN